jgi:hypothetical protein
MKYAICVKEKASEKTKRNRTTKKHGAVILKKLGEIIILQRVQNAT